MPKGKKTLLMLLLSSHVSGCVPHVDERQVNNAQPSLTEPARKVVSKRDADPTITSEVRGDLVLVNVNQTTECQETLRTPMTVESGTERSLTNGTLAQGLNLVAAGALVAGGLGVYSAAGGNCTTTPQPTAQDPNPASRPCTADEADKEKQTTKTTGIVVSSLAVIPIGLFVWNIFRAKDEKTTTTSVKEDTGNWTACGSRPLEGIHLTLKLGGGPGGAETRMSATTNAGGQASFNLASARSSSDRAELLALVPQGERTSEVSLRGTPMRTATEQEVAATARERTRIDDERRAASEAVLAKLQQWGTSAIKVTWATKSHHTEECYNRVDTVVPCDSQAAFRKSTSDIDETIATTHNATTAPMFCKSSSAADDFLKSSGLNSILSSGNNNSMVSIAPRGAYTFSSKSTGGMGALSGMLNVKGAATVSVMCGTSLGELRKYKAMPADLIGAIDGGDDRMVAIAIVRDAGIGTTEVRVQLSER